MLGCHSMEPRFNGKLRPDAEVLFWHFQVAKSTARLQRPNRRDQSTERQRATAPVARYMPARTTGAEKFAGLVVIQATVPGTGCCSTKVMITFDPLRHNQRAALLLVKGVVCIAWAYHGLENGFLYLGWVMGYNATTLAQVAAYLVTSNGEQGGSGSLVLAWPETQ